MNYFNRELLLAWRGRGETAAHFMFVLLITTLFPFALGPDEALLQKLASGLILLALLLGQMLGFERLFSADYQNGTLDIVPRNALPLYALIKSFAQWCALCVPVIVLSPLLMLMLHVEPSAMTALLLAMILASLLVQLLGMLGAALAIGARSAGLLLPLLLIPFYIPVMIFAVSLAGQGFSGEGLQALYFLAALFFLYLSTLPFLTSSALRSAIEAS